MASKTSDQTNPPNPGSGLSSSGLNLIFGSPVFGNPDFSPELSSPEATLQVLSILSSHGVKHLDTAQLYEGSEAAIGQAEAGTKHGFAIDTKWVGGFAGPSRNASYDTIVESAKASLEKLKVDSVEVFYIHAPDPTTSIEETLRGVNDVYKTGAFKKFGLSNYSTEQVEEVVKVCKEKGYVRPSVYEGNYSAMARLVEDDLLPVLRKEGISFMAYSPIAGGLLTKNREFVESRQGRFSDPRSATLYEKMYTKPSFLEFLDKWEEIAKDEDIPKAEMAFRWINHHSALKSEHGDGLVFGAMNFKHIGGTCDILQAGPLSENAAQRIDDLWTLVKADSINNNYQALFG